MTAVAAALALVSGVTSQVDAGATTSRDSGRSALEWAAKTRLVLMQDEGLGVPARRPPSSRLTQLTFAGACCTGRRAECFTEGDPRPEEFKERAMSSDNASANRSLEPRSDGQFPSATCAGRITGVWT